MQIISLVVNLVKRPICDHFVSVEKKHISRATYVLENLVPWRMTLSTASKKSRSDATFLRARIANIPAYEENHECVRISESIC